MKTEAIDFIYSTLLLTIFTALSILSVYSLSPVLSSLIGDYYVILGALLFLLFFGLQAILFCKVSLMISPMKEGRYKMSSGFFTFWKLYTVIYEFGRGALLPFTTLFFRPVLLKFFSAKIGKDVAIGGHLVDPQLISIGDYAIIGQDSVITAHTITSGEIILSAVKIGARATIGVNAVLMSGVEVGEGAVVTASSVVPPERKIPAGEMWGGIPAQKIKDVIVD